MTDWLTPAVVVERRRLGVIPRRASQRGKPWTAQDESDMRYLAATEGRGLVEIAEFLQRNVDDVANHLGVMKPAETNVISMFEQGRSRRRPK